jgi:predicted GIY-YIG superfamily endonuclease
MAKKKEYTVYLLRNTDTGEIEYVGCSSRVKARMYQHTQVTPENYHGKFYGRTNLELVSVQTFLNKKEALRYEGKLKLQYGFEWTEVNGSKPFLVYSYKSKELVGTYYSFSEAVRDLGFNLGNMCQVVAGKRNQTGGYYGRYEMD